MNWTAAILLFSIGAWAQTASPAAAVETGKKTPTTDALIFSGNPSAARILAGENSKEKLVTLGGAFTSRYLGAQLDVLRPVKTPFFDTGMKNTFVGFTRPELGPVSLGIFQLKPTGSIFTPHRQTDYGVGGKLDLFKVVELFKRRSSSK